MPSPVVKVEIAPANGPTDAAPTWIDVSSYARLVDGITFGRGRADELSTTSPGSLSLSLNNDDGRFTPGNVTSPYAPLRTGCPIRVSLINAAGVTYDSVTTYDSAAPYDSAGTTSVRFTGNVTDWGAAFVNGYRPVVRVSATDRWAALQRQKLRTLYDEELDLSNPLAIYTLAQPTGSTTVPDSSGNSAAALTIQKVNSGGFIDFGLGRALSQDERTATTFTVGGSARNYSVLTGPNLCVGSTWTIEAWIATSGSIIDGGIAVFPTNGSYPFEYAGLILQSGGLSDGAFFTSAATINDGKWHHVAVTFAAGTATYYVDGVTGTEASGGSAETTSPAFTSTFTSSLQVGGYTRINSGGDTLPLPFNGNIFGLAMYQRRLSSAEILAHYQAGAASVAVDARIRRLAAIAQCPVTMTGSVGGTVGYQAASGNAVADLLNDCGQIAGGSITVGPDGGIVAAFRDVRYNATPIFTLLPRDIATSTEWLHNDAYIANDVSITRPNGAELRARSASSVAAVGDYPLQRQLPAASDSDATALAQEIVSARSEPNPQPRVADLRVDLLAKAATVPTNALLAANTGTLFRVANLPTGSPTAYVDLHVEGITESIRPDAYELTLATSPRLVTSNVIVLDDNTYGVTADSGDLTLSSAVTASATSIAIASTQAPLSTDAADYPLTLRLGDELVTITAAPVAATSPQTVTVTRGVSPSAARAWPAGTAISLATDPRLSFA